MSIQRGAALAIGLSPLCLLALVGVLSGPGFRPAAPTAQGVVFGVAGLLAVAGTALLYRARSPRAAGLAFALFTMPALALVVFGPAIALLSRS